MEKHVVLNVVKQKEDAYRTKIKAILVFRFNFQSQQITKIINYFIIDIKKIFIEEPLDRKI